MCSFFTFYLAVFWLIDGVIKNSFFSRRFQQFDRAVFYSLREFPFLLYPSLIIIAGGFGVFTPSVITLLGELYQDKESLREAGFSIYYASINIGVFLALFWLGIIAKTVGWNAAFLLAAIIQGLGLIPIMWYFRQLRIPHKRDRQTSQTFHLPKNH